MYVSCFLQNAIPQRSDMDCYCYFTLQTSVICRSRYIQTLQMYANIIRELNLLLNIHVKIYFYFIVSYKVSDSTDNCDPTLVVATKKDCEDASNQLGLTFKYGIKKNERHAGCYKDDDITYFNKIINPSDTSPKFGKKDRRAICKVYGRLISLFL